MLECERGFSAAAVSDRLPFSPSGSPYLRPSSFASQVSNLSNSFTESLDFLDQEEYATSRKGFLDEMVFSSGGGDFSNPCDASDDVVEDIFDFSDPESEVNSEPETGSVHDIPSRLNARPKLIKSFSTSTDDRYEHLHQYKLMDQIIGEGTTSVVKLAINSQDNNRYAMKILSKARLMKRAMLFKKSSNPSVCDPYREIAILRKLHHPNIVKLVDVLDDPEEDELYMVFELLEGGKILDIPTRSPLSESQARLYFRDILSGVEYLHLNGIIHRDLKPDNMLLDDDKNVKIADFGLSGEFLGDNDEVTCPNGTPAFTAPECLDGERKRFSGQAIDMWSLGVTLFAMIYGDVPFKDENVYRLYERVRNDDIVFPNNPHVSSDCKDLIAKLLAKNPSKRITMSEAINHPWISMRGKDPLPTRRGSLVPVPEDLTREDVDQAIHKVPKVKRFILIRKLSNGVTGFLQKRKRRLSANSELDCQQAMSQSPLSAQTSFGSRRNSINQTRLFKRGRKPDYRK